MLKRIGELLLYIILISSIGLLFAVYKNPEVGFYIKRLFGLAPCQKPLTYTLGRIDSDFGLSQNEFLKILSEAESVWEKATNKNLFQYSVAGKMKINLIYDERQSGTSLQKDINQNIERNKSYYDSLVREYQILKSSYESGLANFNAEVSSLNNQKDQLEKEISRWNKKGGAPKEVYENLKAEGDALYNLSENLKRKQTELNNKISEINNTAMEINKLAKEINLNVTDYNQISRDIGVEFDEGAYVEDTTGKSINIYQYGDIMQLKRVLAHELGHALGLDHVEDPRALMYRLNAGENLELKNDDKAELKKVCKINLPN